MKTFHCGRCGRTVITPITQGQKCPGCEQPLWGNVVTKGK